MDRIHHNKEFPNLIFRRASLNDEELLRLGDCIDNMEHLLPPEVKLKAQAFYEACWGAVYEKRGKK